MKAEVIVPFVSRPTATRLAPADGDPRPAEQSGSLKIKNAGSRQTRGLARRGCRTTNADFVLGRRLARNMVGHNAGEKAAAFDICLLYTSPSPRDGLLSRMPSSA